jgi:hypothetical protein
MKTTHNITIYTEELKVIFFSWIQKQLAHNPRILLLTLDLGYPHLQNLLKQFPQQVLNLGVCEQNALLVSAGLSRSGFRVYLYGASSFTLWRGAEILKLYLQDLNQVTIVGNGGGFAYGVMGPTHHNLNDYGLLRLISPEILCYFPCHKEHLLRGLDSSLKENKLQYFRLINPQYKREDLLHPAQVTQPLEVRQFTDASVSRQSTQSVEARKSVESPLTPLTPLEFSESLKSIELSLQKNYESSHPLPGLDRILKGTKVTVVLVGPLDPSDLLEKLEKQHLEREIQSFQAEKQNLSLKNQTLDEENTGSVDLFFLFRWPCSIEPLLKSLRKTGCLHVYEEHLLAGSISQELRNLSQKTIPFEVISHCISSSPHEYRDRLSLLHSYGIQPISSHLNSYYDHNSRISE